LAWNVHGRRLTGAARVLHPPQCGGIAGVETAKPSAVSNNIVLLSIGAFLIQFFVQGAWGIIPFIRMSVAMHAISGNGSQIEAGSGEKISDRIIAPGSG
jgi:hypothetical protein